MAGYVNPKTCCQVCIVCRDLEATRARYAELFGVPEPELLQVPPVEFARTTYRGKPSATQARFCVFNMGQVVLEIMEPDEHDSSWKEALGDKEVAFHHIGFVVDDPDKAMEFFAQQGCEERHVGHYPPNGTYMLPDSFEKFGILFNLKYEPNE